MSHSSKAASRPRQNINIALRRPCQYPRTVLACRQEPCTISQKVLEALLHSVAAKTANNADDAAGDDDDDDNDTDDDNDVSCFNLYSTELYLWANWVAGLV